ncbi:UPF0450 protein C17orf58 homolog isoform X2 [Engystomops pustulosus]|uniref:UPF0450 protein C17orf58 homolog isoform X2 n=1 Tax=Engystomops pustulosus TaxID=76066 RepID=UPI003AFA2F72
MAQDMLTPLVTCSCPTGYTPISSPLYYQEPECRVLDYEILDNKVPDCQEFSRERIPLTYALDSSPQSPAIETEDHFPVHPLGRLHLPPPRPADGRKTLKTKTKTSLDNNTGLRKADAPHSNSLPANDHSGRPAANQHGSSRKVGQDQNQPDPALTSPHRSSKGVPNNESNRPRKMGPKAVGASQNSSRTTLISNRDPTSLLQQISVLRKEGDSRERSCLECHKERDEREAYCSSDFAVNGIIHDVDTVARGVQILTVLVNSGGFYKMNRLYITPDGVFFRVTILAVGNPTCPKPCLHLKMGGRYIIMGQIYQKRMELPLSLLGAVGGRLRAGDGLVTSGRSFIRRFTRKKDRKVLAAAHSRCR